MSYSDADQLWHFGSFSLIVLRTWVILAITWATRSTGWRSGRLFLRSLKPVVARISSSLTSVWYLHQLAILQCIRGLVPSTSSTADVKLISDEMSSAYQYGVRSYTCRVSTKSSWSARSERLADPKYALTGKTTWTWAWYLRRVVY